MRAKEKDTKESLRMVRKRGLGPFTTPMGIDMKEDSIMGISMAVALRSTKMVTRSQVIGRMES